MVINARPCDLTWISQMQRDESNALGFVPERRLAWEIQRGRILICSHSNDRLGYVYRGSTASGVLPIYQACTEPGVRRHTVGQALIAAAEAAALEAGCWGLECRCREDLAANQFWSALRFNVIRSVPGGGGRRRLVNVYERSIVIGARTPLPLEASCPAPTTRPTRPASACPPT